MIPFPPVELIHSLLELRTKKSFLRISRILLLCLVVLAALGYAGVWAKGLEPSAPGCQHPDWDCYTGGELSLSGFIQELGGSQVLIALPIANLGAAVFLLFRFRRTYLYLMVVGLFSTLLLLYFSSPRPYVSVSHGSGYFLAQLACFLYGLFALPMAILEQSQLPARKSRLNTDLDPLAPGAPKE